MPMIRKWMSTEADCLRIRLDARLQAIFPGTRRVATKAVDFANMAGPNHDARWLLRLHRHHSFDADRTRLAPPRSSALGGREKPAEGEGSLSQLLQQVVFRRSNVPEPFFRLFVLLRVLVWVAQEGKASVSPSYVGRTASFGESQHDVCAKLIHGLASHGAVFQGFA